MRRIRSAIAISLPLAALALGLAGCGDAGSSSPGATSANAGRAVTLESPVLAATHTIPRNYTCDGRDVSLPLRWGPVPAGTRELAVLLLALQPVRTIEGKVLAKIVPQWGVIGLAPTLRQLAPGRLPPGAVLGHNANGRTRYSICPARGTSERYVFALFTLPRRLVSQPGFTDQALFSTLNGARVPYGELTAIYSRA